jgi:hypothetical protein
VREPLKVRAGETLGGVTHMKKRISQGAKLGFAVLPFCLALLPGCGAAVEGEDEGAVGEVNQELFSGLPDPVINPNPPDLASLTGSCRLRNSDGVIVREGEQDGGGESRSPTKYGTTYCAKSWVVDIHPNPIPKDADMNRVQWADPWKRNRAQCLGATLKVSVYSSAFDFTRGVSSDFPRYEGSVEAPLAWDAEKQVCKYAWINIYHRDADGNKPAVWGLMAYQGGNNTYEEGVLSDVAIRNYNGRSLRIIASALAPGGNSTQPLWIWSHY